MFLPKKNMKDLIIRCIKEEEQSISSLSRKLNDDGYKLHRLVLTGYLKALADVGVLKEKNIPPSKVYTASTYSERSIYEMVGEKCKLLEGLDEGEKVKISIYVLQKLFHRPIFLQEIKQCGLSEDAIEGERVKGEERSEAKSILKNEGLKIGRDEPAYKIKGAGSLSYEEMVNSIMADILIDKFRIRSLAAGTKQLKLEEL